MPPKLNIENMADYTDRFAKFSTSSMELRKCPLVKK